MLYFTLYKYLTNAYDMPVVYESVNKGLWEGERDMFKLLDGQKLDREATAHSRATAGAIKVDSETVLRRASHLVNPDRMIVELFIRGQCSHRRIGTLLEMPHGTVTRRLRRIGQLLHDPMIVRLLDGPCPLERTDRQIAVGYFLHRRSLRDLAMMHQLSPTHVSQRVQFVRGWFRGASTKNNAE